MEELIKTIDSYLIAGQEAPTGLIEEHYERSRVEYVPELNVRVAYKLITGKDYSTPFHSGNKECGHDEVAYDEQDIISEPHEQTEPAY
ncbi:MAG: hypothetical protein WC055_14660 [Melioribacteraceae bacterium]